MTETSERRAAFITRLYGLGDALERDGHDTSEARRVLAQLRRSLTHGYQPAAWQLVTEHNPPEAEEETWLLVSGLFATHPSPLTPRSSRQSLGAALQSTGAHGATERRMQQLISVGPDSIDHYVRQALHLARAHRAPVDYLGLLNDLLVLRVEPLNSQRSHRVRMKWARDFHLARAAADHSRTNDPSEGASA